MNEQITHANAVRTTHFYSNSSVVFTVTEIQTKYTVKHNTLLPYNSALHVSAHQNHHQATFITEVSKR